MRNTLRWRNTFSEDTQTTVLTFSFHGVHLDVMFVYCCNRKCQTLFCATQNLAGFFYALNDIHVALFGVQQSVYLYQIILLNYFLTKLLLNKAIFIETISYQKYFYQNYFLLKLFLIKSVSYQNFSLSKLFSIKIISHQNCF